MIPAEVIKLCHKYQRPLPRYTRTLKVTEFEIKSILFVIWKNSKKLGVKRNVCVCVCE